MLTLLGLGLVGLVGAGTAAKFGFFHWEGSLKLPGSKKSVVVEFSRANPVRVDLE